MKLLLILSCALEASLGYGLYQTGVPIIVILCLVYLTIILKIIFISSLYTYANNKSMVGYLRECVMDVLIKNKNCRGYGCITLQPSFDTNCLQRGTVVKILKDEEEFIAIILHAYGDHLVYKKEDNGYNIEMLYIQELEEQDIDLVVIGETNTDEQE